MKTSELIGPALDWAVAKAEGAVLVLNGREWWYSRNGVNGYGGIWERRDEYTPSVDWAQGGPIIDCEKIGVYPSQSVSGVWAARPDYKTAPSAPHTFGPTPLVAAMRCYVASKLGDEVEIPEELR